MTHLNSQRVPHRTFLQWNNACSIQTWRGFSSTETHRGFPFDLASSAAFHALHSRFSARILRSTCGDGCRTSKRISASLSRMHLQMWTHTRLSRCHSCASLSRMSRRDSLEIMALNTLSNPNRSHNHRSNIRLTNAINLAASTVIVRALFLNNRWSIARNLVRFLVITLIVS